MDEYSTRLLAKARRSLAAAQALLDRGDADFAVSRAYYAMLYAAQAGLWSRGFKFKRHSAVISAFARELVKSGQLRPDLHAWFRRAFEQRGIGDYGADVDVAADSAAVVLQNATEFVREVEALLTE